MAVYEGEPPSPYTPVFRDIYVVPEDLERFAELVEGDLGALRDAWNNARTELEDQPSPNFPGGYPNDISYANGYPEVLDNGSEGIYEGKEFYRAYFLTLGASLQLMDDVMRGLSTLHQAARMIHTDYLASDASNASSLAGAFGAYERSSVLHALGEAETTDGGTGDEPS